MSSSGATVLNTSSPHKGFITLLPGKKYQGLYQKCSTPIGIGRADIFLSKGRIGYAVQRSRTLCHMTLTTLGA